MTKRNNKEPNNSQLPIQGKILLGASIAVFGAGVLLYSYYPKCDGVSVFLMLAGLVFAFGVSIWSRGKLADTLAEKLGLKRSDDYFSTMADASLRGTAAGIPVEMKIIEVEADIRYPLTRPDFGAAFNFQVENPAGLDLAIVTENLLDRPLGLFPPEIKNRPEWLKKRRLELRANPEKLPVLMVKLEALEQLAGPDWRYIRLEDSSLQIRIKRETVMYSIDELKTLLDKAAKAADIFNR